MKILLLNRMLGYDGLNTALKGYSGKAYGSLSRYSPEHKCHVVELSFAEYEAAREDLFKKMRQGMSGFLVWEPMFIPGDALPTALPVPPAPVVPENPPATILDETLPRKEREPVKAVNITGAKTTRAKTTGAKPVSAKAQRPGCHEAHSRPKTRGCREESPKARQVDPAATPGGNC